MENEDREPDPSLLHALESYSAPALGPNWGAALDPELISNLGKYRRYDYTAMRDLLRVVRNKRNHFREMPQELQRLMGPLPDGFYRCGTVLVCVTYVLDLLFVAAQLQVVRGRWSYGQVQQ